MKKIKKTTKIAVSSEVVRQLETEKLDKIAGGLTGCQSLDWKSCQDPSGAGN